MGATTFETIGLGKDAGAAYRTAVDDALWSRGHDGYTGTIAEKAGFELFTLPKGVTARRVMDKIDDAHWALICEENPSVFSTRREGPNARQRNALAYLREKFGRDAESLLRTYDDKWGPAVAFELTNDVARKAKEHAGRKGTHDKVFLFCGYASC